MWCLSLEAAVERVPSMEDIPTYWPIIRKVSSDHARPRPSRWTLADRLDRWALASSVHLLDLTAGSRLRTAVAHTT